MSTNFWASYISGSIGILVGNPLDVIKVRLQTRQVPRHHLGPTLKTCSSPRPYLRSLTAGTAAPVLGYGALNALLFVSYRQAEALLSIANTDYDRSNSLCLTWLAGAWAGLCTWILSTPTEFIKCQAQTSSASSFDIARRTWHIRGLSGLYRGGTVTALRDSIGYGFYFSSYQLASSYWPCSIFPSSRCTCTHTCTNGIKTLLCGGLAGVASWASVFPLDVIKTRVQAQSLPMPNIPKSLNPLQIAIETFSRQGVRSFYRGFGVCSVRAFIVNGVQWTVYEFLRGSHSLGTSGRGYEGN